VTLWPGGAKKAELRYKAFGETRYTSSSTPTTYRCTGQREESAIGLCFYRGRWYDVVLGRFVQADTIVSNPANPQSLNRYSYVLNNPLRYTDPTGMSSEDEIMGYLGVGTWEEVLAFFVTGGELEGRWGWLETLRAAELGDVVQFFCDYEGLWPAWLGATVMAEGQFVEQGGQLYIQFGGTLTTASQAAWWGNAFGVRRTSSSSPGMYFGPYYAERTYHHRRFDPSGVDWVGVGLDAVGILADTISHGIGGRATNAAQVARAAEQAGVLINAASLLRSGVPLAVDLAEGDPSLADSIGFGLDVAGIYFPFGPDMAGIVWGISEGFYFTP